MKRVDQAGRTQRRQHLKRWLFLPQLVSFAAFSISLIIVFATGTNRLHVGLYLGTTGFIATALAAVALVVALIAHPWRNAAMHDWLVIAAHFAGLLACLALGIFWMGLHLA